MPKVKDGDFFISDWLRNINTLEYLRAWESINNPNFNYGEFATIRSRSGVNSYKISVRTGLKKRQQLVFKGIKKNPSAKGLSNMY